MALVLHVQVFDSETDEVISGGQYVAPNDVLTRAASPLTDEYQDRVERRISALACGVYREALQLRGFLPPHLVPGEE